MPTTLTSTFGLYPPDEGDWAALSDELKLIEWNNPDKRRKHGHLRLNGSATVELVSVAGQDTDISWTKLDE